MNNSKEEADVAIEAATNKFLAKDYAGARRFALTAKFLTPEFVGITQMVATFAVHLAAQHTINGEMDYYGMLGVSPQANDETLQKRYEKLVAVLHPDSNKSIGAEEAFTLFSEAWGVLSDKAKRAEYDSKTRNSGASSSANNGAQKAAAKGKTPKRGAKRASDASTSSAPPALVPAAAPGVTFWTVCSICKTQYEHHPVYLNQNLTCSHCRNLFTTVETAPSRAGSLGNTFYEPHFDSISHLTDGREKSRDDNGDALASAGGAVYTGTQTSAHGSQLAVHSESSTKRAASPSTNPPPKRRNVVVEAGSNVASSSSAPPPPNSTSVREFSKEEVRTALLKKSKPTIVTNLHDLMTVDVPEINDVNMANAAGSSQEKNALTINVPYPDFCDFDKNRTEKSFGDEEIWAAYDSSERMPRVYFMIDKVLSVYPFKLCITKLTTSEPPMSSNQLGLGVRRTCGVFRAGKSKICKSPYIFSHKMDAVKGDHGEFQIYPRTFEVWALYKNWSRDWSYPEGGEAVEYDLVEVFEGYTEAYGVRVSPLIKAAGFTSVFRHHPDLGELRTFSKDELSRFSHQIPSYLLTVRDAADELKGCRQLDPTATPSQFLHVIDG